MIYPHIHLGWKFIAWSVSCTSLAVTEAFLGQMAIALVVALIGAAPPTVAIIMMARQQSTERRDQNKVILENQTKIAKDLDGKLTDLRKAETGQAKAEGIIEGGDKEQARVAATPPAHAPAPPAAAADTTLKMEIVNDENNAVPTVPGVKKSTGPAKE